MASSGTCPACGDDVGPDDALSVGDLVFHHGCLLCTVCGRNMEGKPVTLDTSNKVYCTEDYDRLVKTRYILSLEINVVIQAVLFCLRCLQEVNCAEKGRNKSSKIEGTGKRVSSSLL